MTFDYIVTGSAGLLGSHVTAFLEGRGYKVLGLDLNDGHDLADEEYVRQIFQVNKAFGLINLFAIDQKVSHLGFSSDFLNIDLGDFQKSMDVNVVALFSVCREFIRNNDSGSIVNFSSIYGIRSPNPDIYPRGEKPIYYGVSKAAVLQLTRHLAVHAAPDFKVNSIVLGGVFDLQEDTFLSSYIAGVPLKRMANPSDVFGAILFLASRENSYVTGTSIVVDGGRTIL